MITDMQFRFDGQRINACLIRDYRSKGLYPFHLSVSRLNEVESTLLTRLNHEQFCGIMKFQRALIPGTPIDEIDNALVSEKYLLFIYLYFRGHKHYGVYFVGIFVR